LGVSLAWFPRRFHATPEQRLGFEISREGLHRDEIDEGLSIAAFRGAGQPSQASRGG
jgi:hypothetical protein